MTICQSQRIVGLLVGFVLVGVMLFNAEPAGAFWANYTSCGRRTAAIQEFSADPTWDQFVGPLTFRAVSQAAFAGWRSETRSPLGGYALSTSSGSTFTWRWDDDFSAAAHVTCGFGFKDVEFNLDYMDEFLSGGMDFAGLAWHESGHVWGINHSGRYDSFGANPPTMSTCDIPGNGSLRVNLSQDDEAAVQFLAEVSGAYRSGTANSSFEEGTQWWGLSGQTPSLTTSSNGGGVDGSPYYAVMGSGGTDSYIYSTSRYIEGWSASVIGRANFRKNSATNDQGHVLVVLAWRQVSYADDVDTCWDSFYFQRKRLSSPDPIDDFTDHWYPSVCYPTASWTYCDTAWSDISSTNTAHEPTAIDVRIYFYNRMRAYPGGYYTLVHLDRTRVRIDD